jgi:hypothetical protein
MKNGLLCSIENVAGCKTEALLIPVGRRKQVLILAHEMFDVHLASIKTRDRIRLSGMTWPTLISDCVSLELRSKPLNALTMYTTISL